MSVTRRIRSAVVIAAIALVAALAAPTAATAAPPVRTAAADMGWLRLGHFSPETKDVDVRVAALSGGSVLFELSGVGYGDVSPYQALPNGSYTVSMVPAGSTDWTKLALSATVKIEGGTATTAAAYGPTKALKVRLYQDDLTAPTAGNARIRVIQASTLTPSVDVRTSTGVSIASKAKAGTATAYAEVPGGDWTLRLTGSGVSDTADVNVAAGTVTSLFVLDTADGGLTIVPVLDSAAAALVPIGGVQTGGGWLASHDADAERAFARIAK
ncbi:DUF4397 domain-containing protein [Microbacterium aoyamense]|uniref:DUF4397 domain-containing protein n=1 Tax=Microbacterium aoyamense TaxID=344166 RepID=A0ABN2PA56_9MICO|nr:DUF4397 domain-containing protein [Microbacterium aoyamense]